MKDTKFRYVVEHDRTHEIHYYYYPLDQIEETGGYQLANPDNTIRWDFIGRDLWTGLHDKTGKDIYENDIILMDYGTALVFWDEKTACFKVDFPLDQDLLWLFSADAEIIGNKYEPPESCGGLWQRVQERIG